MITRWIAIASLCAVAVNAQAVEKTKEVGKEVARGAEKAVIVTKDAAVTVGKKTEEGAKVVAKGTKKAVTKSGPTVNATPAQIADAKSKGLVWGNANSKVYHKDGEFYGATKEGKFMTVSEAEKTGYHEAKHNTPKKK
jgi:hypothetical protein